MKSLPSPVAGGLIEELRPFLNVRDEADFVLAVSWLLGALRNRGPYPVLVLAGEQGSAKSTLSTILRALIDPNAAPLRTLPREERDFFVSANNSHVMAFDNVSGLPGWISDTLCRLSTGGGFSTRQLYTDSDEVLFNAMRPQILNGIEDVVNRPDLGDRSLFLTLEPISEELRRPEAELWADFEARRPRILGALLDAVSHGLRQLPMTQLATHPRMADFAIWANACETALWRRGTFEAAYNSNREGAIAAAIENDPVASAVRSFMETRTQWEGTPTQLFAELEAVAGERTFRGKTWPKAPNVVSNRLRRMATFLRKVGIDVLKMRDNENRTIRLTRSARTSREDERSSPKPKDRHGSSPLSERSDDRDGRDDLFPTLRVPGETVAPKGDGGDLDLPPLTPETPLTWKGEMDL
jgi:hypothetical protein